MSYRDTAFERFGRAVRLRDPFVLTRSLSSILYPMPGTVWISFFLLCVLSLRRRLRICDSIVFENGSAFMSQTCSMIIPRDRTIPWFFMRYSRSVNSFRVRYISSAPRNVVCFFVSWTRLSIVNTSLSICSGRRKSACILARSSWNE